MIVRSVTTSVRRKLMLVIFAITFLALFLSACAMVIYDAYSYQRSWVGDVTTQARIIARVSGSAISFNDPKAARENLETLVERPQILAAAIFTTDGKQFAAYSNGGAITKPEALVSAAGTRGDGYRIEGDQLLVYYPVTEGHEVVGTVYLRARYELVDRTIGYVTILALAMVAIMVVTGLVAARLQRTITGPILAITGVAQRVMQSRDFSLRAEKRTNDEIGVLVDAFNGMLGEVSQRAEALEQSNRTLAQEMVVRRNAEASLKLADRRKDDFLAMLAHELRNPLAPISAAAELLRFAQTDTERIRKASDVIGRQVQHMTRLIDDLLDVSRVTRGLIVIEKQPRDIKAIVADAVEQVRPLINARGHELEVDVPPAAARVLGDEKRLVQVIANLLANAAKYTPERGKISLQMTLERNEVVLAVRDNGIGMEEELLGRVFELFAQAERTSDRSQGGLGLGLALVRSLVELHGGQVSAHSAGVGKGSEFIVRLPRISDQPAFPATPEALPERPANAHALRIMVVDDNKDAAQTLAILLEASGHTVFVEFESPVALNRARAIRPSVCLLDIGLPEMDGNELARRLRSQPETARAVLIAISGYGQKQDKETAIAAGFDHYFVKPVDTRKLLAVLGQVDVV
jgi:signal transduction histidine kinase